MTLVKMREYYPVNSQDTSDKDDIKGFGVYAQGDDKVGSVEDMLVDEQTGQFRYFVVDTGFWVFGKKVLLPVGLATVDYDDKRIYVNGLSKQQVENLPEFGDLEKVDYDYEEQVRGVYRPIATTGNVTQPDYDRDTYNYEQEPSLYNVSDRPTQTQSASNAQSLKLYQERLIADKQRRKAAEVTIGKHVETETASVSVPVEKERVIIERTTPTDATPIDPRNADFHEGEMARMEIYEETPDIHKEAFVREEVQVKKVVDKETVNAEETLRREELDIDTAGRPIVDKDR